MGRNKERKKNGYCPLVDVGGGMGNGKKPDRASFHDRPAKMSSKNGLPLQ